MSTRNKERDTLFSFYGTKKKIAGLYPAPKYDTIIEPFAGAAAYSLHGDNWKKRVILYDIDPKIVAVWDHLIKATKEDILRLPNVVPGDKVTDFDLIDAPRWLIGFCINPGSSCPKITASKRSHWARYREQIANSVDKIKHWTINRETYEEIENLEATWFIDPPYQKAGKYYKGHGKIDFAKLGEWCKSRKGQVIVCENQGADWLPFRFLTEHRGSMQKNTEVIWTNE